MPLAVDRLTKRASTQTIKDAISASIAKLIEEGHPANQAKAIAYRVAEEKSGKQLGKK